jgi:hypothetical protein
MSTKKGANVATHATWEQAVQQAVETVNGMKLAMMYPQNSWRAIPRARALSRLATSQHPVAMAEGRHHSTRCHTLLGENMK